jgi:CBS domain-containing protein
MQWLAIRTSDMSTPLRPQDVLDPQPLAAGPSFVGLSPALPREILARAERLSLKPGTAVFRAGEAPKHRIYVIYRGEVEVQRPDGNTYRVEAGDFLGVSAYLDDSAYSATAIARGAVELLVLSEEVMRELERDVPDLANALNRSIARRIRRWSPARAVSGGVLGQSVRGIMRVPLASCKPQASLREAFEVMHGRKIGSMGVVDGDGKLVGLVTRAGMSEAVLLRGASPEQSVAEAALETPATISADAALWQAEDLQQRLGVKYLVVVEDELPVGMLSQTDIVRTLSARHSTYVRRAQAAASMGELKGIRAQIGECAAETREGTRRASVAVRALSEAHLAIQQRCVELTLEALQAEGRGAPPIPYAVLIMGSGGRCEMMLEPDQDNGLILADVPEASDPAVQGWFAHFAEQFNIRLGRVGYMLCPGEIMARNPMFRKSLADWKRQIGHLAEYPNEKAARWSNIVFDFDTLYGDAALTAALRKHVQQALDRKSRLLQFMVADDAEGRPPLGWFNRLITSSEEGSRGKIDIKRNGLRIVADAARIYALSAGIRACNTQERLGALVRQGLFSADFIDTVSAGYEELLGLLLDHQIAQVRRGEPPDKLIDPKALPLGQQEGLRAAMRAVRSFQDRLQGDFAMLAF